jgi:hypothetical protein
MRTTFLASFVLVINFATSASAAQTFDCKFDTIRGKGFVQDRIQFVIDEEHGAATLFDQIISTLHGPPVKAKISTNQSGRYWLRWQVENVPVTTTRTVEGFEMSSVKRKSVFNYQAWLNSKTMQIKVRVKSGRISGRIASVGNCKIKR